MASAILVTQECPYQLQSVAPTVAPDGAEGVWHRYVISQGKTVVTGLRSGSVAEVDYFLRDMIERLNERRMGKTRPRIKPAQPAS